MPEPLFIDLESYSTPLIGQCGSYRYAADPSFEILLFSYAWGQAPVTTIDLARGQLIPSQLLAALDDPKIEKWAFNANFERTCLSAHLGKYLAPAGWKCHMVWAATLGLPLSLDQLCKALKLERAKLDTGKQCIKYFCTPNITAGRDLFNTSGQARRRPGDNPDLWESFKTYNARDVEAEQELHVRLQAFPPPPGLWEEYWLDQAINDRGIRVDVQLAKQAVDLNQQATAQLLSEAKDLTGLANPKSVQQLRGWLEQQGLSLPSLSKQVVADAIKTAPYPARRVLKIRQQISKSSTKKYEAMLQAADRADQRARGLVQFCGAARTGRWAGRLIQVQNLPRNSMGALDAARRLVKGGDLETLNTIYDSLPGVLSQLIRTAFVPREGYRFIVADFSAIEARVLAWLAGETSTLEAFRAGKDLYCETAARMFGIPVEKHGVNAHLRQKEKIATLACGYQGGVGALKAMGATRMGLGENELGPIVKAWRTANPRIVRLWRDLEKAAAETITTGKATTVGKLRLFMLRGALQIRLPSGRCLTYLGAQVCDNQWGRPQVTHMGMNAARQWASCETYGGKLTENVVQAAARDLLAVAMRNLEDAGYQVVMHVHDEVIIEHPKTQGTVDQVVNAMTAAPDWAEGLPLDADGYECAYYRKD